MGGVEGQVRWVFGCWFDFLKSGRMALIGPVIPPFPSSQLAKKSDIMLDQNVPPLRVGVSAVYDWSKVVQRCVNVQGW